MCFIRILVNIALIGITSIKVCVINDVFLKKIKKNELKNWTEQENNCKVMREFLMNKKVTQNLRLGFT